MKKGFQKKLERIFSRHRVSFAYLFGSYASGQPTAASDIDIAVYFEDFSKEIRFEKRLALLKEIGDLAISTKGAPMSHRGSNGLASLRLGLPVDIIVLNDTRSITLRYAVINEGKMLYAKNENLRLEFELMTMKEHEEFAPFLDAYNKAYLTHAI